MLIPNLQYDSPLPIVVILSVTDTFLVNPKEGRIHFLKNKINKFKITCNDWISLDAVYLEVLYWYSMFNKESHVDH